MTKKEALKYIKDQQNLISIIEEEHDISKDDSLCEGCDCYVSYEDVRSDSQGVELCKGCYDELIAEAKEEG